MASASIIEERKLEPIYLFLKNKLDYETQALEEWKASGKPVDYSTEHWVRYYNGKIEEYLKTGRVRGMCRMLGSKSCGCGSPACGCFYGEDLVWIVNPDGLANTVRIKDLNPGDVVSGGAVVLTKVVMISSTPYTLVHIPGGPRITKYHPVRKNADEKWVFPHDIAKPYDDEEC